MKPTGPQDQPKNDAAGRAESSDSPASSHAVVVIGGGPLSPLAVEQVRDDAFIIAADSGLDHAVAAGVRPHALVGDLDSISASGHMWAYAHELEIRQHPNDKDLTDTELALARALAVPGVRQLLLIGGIDDPEDRRLDHVLGTLLSLGSTALAGLSSVRAVLGDTRFLVLHPGRSSVLDVEPGQLFSLLAMHGPCSGITVTGARWELADAALSGTEARGLSNEATEHTEVRVASGVLTVVIP
ncbi:MAG: thiamine diphosphokinase [Actinomycetota bacterium]|nr:thiamine diphosphokinase [Actinomycetota bacterium]